MKNENKSKNITILERIVMFLVISNLPIIVLLYYLVENEFSLDNINYFRIVSLVFLLILIIMLIIQFIFKKQYLALFMGCHQKDSRSLTCSYKHLGVCARCTGILIGIFIFPFLTYFRINSLYFLIGIIPLLVDGLIQKFSNYKSNNLRRIITGILFGPAMMVITSYFYFYTVKLIIYFANHIL